MSDSSVLKFLQVQHDIFIGEETLKLVDTQTKTRRDVSKILWELRWQMEKIDDFFIREENYRGIDDCELAWLENCYEKAEKKRYELAGLKQ